jgi:hypothetical protein
MAQCDGVLPGDLDRLGLAWVNVGGKKRSARDIHFMRELTVLDILPNPNIGNPRKRTAKSFPKRKQLRDFSDLPHHSVIRANLIELSVA